MLKLDLATIAKWTGGQLQGSDARVSTVSIDSRKLARDALFVALRGEHHDGHDFVASAHAHGASGALVERAVDCDCPQVVVANCERALGLLAAQVRRQREICVVGITGSNGKTTVKTLLASILSRHAPTHFNTGSFNNEIGLPLTLLAMPEDSRFAVLEMGAGKPGDIAYLAAIAQPLIGLVNNIAPAHLERLGSVQGIAETKGALYSALPENGVAVVNADDSFADYFAGLAGGRRVIRFGIHAQADVGARFEPAAPSTDFVLTTPLGEVDVRLALVGRHNVCNALAAASLALACEVPLATIKLGLESATAVGGRSARRLHPSGAEVIDDSYNANPASFAAAIATLASFGGRSILVAGDMRELGPDASMLHAGIGELARTSGVDRLFAVGEMSLSAVRAFGDGGLHFPGQQALIEALRSELAPGTTVLVKGSRGSAMDRVVDALFITEPVQGGRHAA